MLIHQQHHHYHNTLSFHCARLLLCSDCRMHCMHFVMSTLSLLLIPTVIIVIVHRHMSQPNAISKACILLLQCFAMDLHAGTATAACAHLGTGDWGVTSRHRMPATSNMVTSDSTCSKASMTHAWATCRPCHMLQAWTKTDTYGQTANAHLDTFCDAADPFMHGYGISAQRAGKVV